MSSPVHAVRPEDDLAHARNLMMRHEVSHLPVVDARGVLQGFVHLDHLARARVQDTYRPRPRALPRRGAVLAARDVAKEGAPEVPPGIDAAEAAMELARAGACCAAVVESRGNGRLVGIVTQADLLPELAATVRGGLRVRDVMRTTLPEVHRHASLDAVLAAFREHGVREAVVTEGRAPPMGSPYPEVPRAFEDPTHGPRRALDLGVVGHVSIRSVAASSWFDTHVPGVPSEKRIKEARSLEVGGSPRARHVEVVNVVAEDMMVPTPGVLEAEEDAGRAGVFMARAGARGMVAVRGGQERPGFVERGELLHALAQRALEA